MYLPGVLSVGSRVTNEWFRSLKASSSKLLAKAGLIEICENAT